MYFRMLSTLVLCFLFVPHRPLICQPVLADRTACLFDVVLHRHGCR